MSNKIKFVARDEFGYKTQPRPYPASQRIPKWWREETPYQAFDQNPDGKKIFVKDGVSNATFKKCVPMLDALSSGYLIDLFADVLVRRSGDHLSITWRTHQDVVSNEGVFQKHGESSKLVQPPPGYSNDVYKYTNTWIPMTPPGYSVLVTEPFGFRDTPFKAIPAVIDSDKSKFELVVPMWLKKNFEGVIEKGTPLIQMTPFKREDWKAEYSYFKDNEYRIEEEKGFNSTLINHYIKNSWSKKTYK